MGGQREAQMSFSGALPASFETGSLLGLEFTNYAGLAWPVSLSDHLVSATLCWTYKCMLRGSSSLCGSSVADHPLLNVSTFDVISQLFKT